MMRTRRDLVRAYQRVKDTDWEPSYIDGAARFVEPTKFHLPRHAIDPFKTFVREYLAVEAEKEHRHYSILEASSRLAPASPDPRWMEGMKFALANLSGLEY